MSLDQLTHLGVKVVALDLWPRPQRTPIVDRTHSQFRATISDTAKVLARELELIWARDASIALAGLHPGLLRRDGMIRADARLGTDPGVVVRFSRDGKAYVYPCDRFGTWQENLRAIALALEALRKVDRYGITSAGEQYAGFAALPAGDEPPGRMTREGAAELLFDEAGFTSFRNVIVANMASGMDDGSRDECWRQARKRTHPDAGGTHERFLRVTEAYELLGGKG